MKHIQKILSRALFGLVVCLSASTMAHAEMRATPLRADARLVEFEYSPDEVYLILCKPKRSVFVRFGPDETITYASAGETKDFDITVPKAKTFMEVKPRFDDVETNATVVTTKRTYHLVLRAPKEGQKDFGKFYARVEWKYPRSNLMDLTEDAIGGQSGTSSAPVIPVGQDGTVRAGVDIKKLNFEYKVEGKADFTPVQVFDDGVFTFIRMPGGLQELPALFALTSESPKDLALVNYDVKGDYLVAQRVMKNFLLRLGKEEVTIKAKRRGFFWGGDEQ